MKRHSGHARRVSKQQAPQAKAAREAMLADMREANERLVKAVLEADDVAERWQAGSRAQDQFLALLGHELRNPLAPIRLALDVIALGQGDAHRREHEIIARQLTQLVGLVDELLDNARVRSGKLALHCRPIELAEIVAAALETTSSLFATNDHQLTVNVPAHGLTVDADALRLVQVVTNLLTNAAKYTPPGGSIDITAERVGPNVVLRVRDTGVGISAEMLPHIFELFVQDKQAATRAAGGLGLGLALVQSLVTLHGGTVTAHSDGIGRGCEIVVELPAFGGDVLAPAPPHVEREPRASIPHKILVVDDDGLATELLDTALTWLGHEVRTASSGQAACTAVAAFVPEIVVMDLALPAIDGYETAARIRAAIAPQVAHFIAFTANGLPADRQRSAAAGFTAHLVKPVGLEALQRAIERCDPPPTAAG